MSDHPYPEAPTVQTSENFGLTKGWFSVVLFNDHLLREAEGLDVWVPVVHIAGPYPYGHTNGHKEEAWH